MTSILLGKKFLGLVEMTSGLVNASFSLPEWQAVKMIFFAPCSRNSILQVETILLQCELVAGYFSHASSHCENACRVWKHGQGCVK